MRTNRPAARSSAARQAFAAAVLANKDKPATPSAADEFDPEAPTVPAAKPVIAAMADAAAAKAKDAPAVEVPKPAAAAAPPAPSLDPEVRKLREEAKREREAVAAERAELEKSRVAKPAEPAVSSVAPDLEAYIDNAPSWLRSTFETMRADKMTDEEFKSEVADLITMLSGDVLGVPLPESVRTKLEAAQAKKMVRTHKTIQTRKEAEATARAEKERLAATEKAEKEAIDREWAKAEKAVSDLFIGADSKAAKAYPWLAVEADPGHHVVSVIQNIKGADGTNLSWEEAAKMANEYLKGEHASSYAKRKALYDAELAAAAPAVKPAAPAPAKPAAVPVVEKPATIVTPSGNQRWNSEKHRENTRAAFRAAAQGKTE